MQSASAVEVGGGEPVANLQVRTGPPAAVQVCATILKVAKAFLLHISRVQGLAALSGPVGD